MKTSSCWHASKARMRTDTPIWGARRRFRACCNRPYPIVRPHSDPCSGTPPCDTASLHLLHLRPDGADLSDQFGHGGKLLGQSKQGVSLAKTIDPGQSMLAMTGIGAGPRTPCLPTRQAAVPRLSSLAFAVLHVYPADIWRHPERVLSTPCRPSTPPRERHKLGVSPCARCASPVSCSGDA